LKLIRAFLTAGVLEQGLVSPLTAGTPQGGPLSPLLSNIVLDELDREVAHRGLRFVRYADDCTIYVQSRRAGLRVLASLTRFLTNRLKLRVNQQKSAVGLGATQTFETAYCAVGDPAVQEPNPGSDASDARSLHCSHGPRPYPVSSGVARLFRKVSDAFSVATVRGVDETATAVGDLDAVETWGGAVCRLAKAGRGSRSGLPNCGKCPWPVAAGPESCPDDCTAQSLLRLTRDSTSTVV
jgi:hypothetical protein